jgi:glycosyltransferase involved in cell wall biosynthesis
MGMTSTRIRVLFINHTSIIGGAETNLLNVLRFADRGGFQPVGVLLPADGPLASEVRKLGVPVGFIRYHAFQWHNPLRYIQTLVQLAEWMWRSRADVIHLNHPWLVEHVVLAGYLLHKPVVCHTRSLLDPQFVLQHRRWFDRASAIVAVSNAVKCSGNQLGLSDQLVLVYDGIDLFRFQSPSDRAVLLQMLSLHEEVPLVGFCGRIVPEKGPEDLIQAVPVVLRSMPDIHIVFCGTDDENGAHIERLKQQAQHLGIAKHTHFIGFRQDVEHVLAAFDVLVLPSRRSVPEGLPLSVVEGLAAGCLVVATPNGGVPEVIHHGETGFLVESEDPGALAASILETLTLPDSEQERIRRTGKKLVATQFSIERQVTQLGQIYRGLVS